MKRLPFLAAILTVAFALVILGLFWGKNAQGDAIRVEISRQTQTAPPETSAQTEAPEEPETISYPIRLNQADKETLLCLPGIGQTLADRILAYRSAHGGFTTVEELANIDGIGPEILDGLRGFVIAG